mmetsp:Transcript_32689/g.101172  ORF Transcript_32689/g.101172 Transcript_32689/m.101172 type:complete len:206 (+) Transcript_32689:733-1350(+)
MARLDLVALAQAVVGPKGGVQRPNETLRDPRLVISPYDESVLRADVRVGNKDGGRAERRGLDDRHAEGVVRRRVHEESRPSEELREAPRRHVRVRLGGRVRREEAFHQRRVAFQLGAARDEHRPQVFRVPVSLVEGLPRREVLDQPHEALGLFFGREPDDARQEVALDLGPLPREALQVQSERRQEHLDVRQRLERPEPDRVALR